MLSYADGTDLSKTKFTEIYVEYVWLYHIFPHYLINGTNFWKKKLLNINCVLIFYPTFVWNISHSKTNECDTIKSYVRFHVNYFQIFNGTWNFSIFEKY